MASLQVKLFPVSTWGSDQAVRRVAKARMVGGQDGTLLQPCSWWSWGVLDKTQHTQFPKTGSKRKPGSKEASLQRFVPASEVMLPLSSLHLHIETHPAYPNPHLLSLQQDVVPGSPPGMEDAAHFKISPSFLCPVTLRAQCAKCRTAISHSHFSSSLFLLSFPACFFSKIPP